MARDELVDDVFKYVLHWRDRRASSFLRRLLGFRGIFATGNSLDALRSQLARSRQVYCRERPNGQLFGLAADAVS
ncbi:hypothetical protein GGD83_003358 [Rhodoblastus sphagnicola]|nr:hypothetical protein [Rhodoblastus sphagnicola]MBB4199542.1 hypothetical protein [Rhodoblastus sphagnicola]